MMASARGGHPPGAPITMRTVAALANIGKAGEAMKVLGDNVVESMNPADAAAEMWLGLSSDDREDTAVFASGRASRAIINTRLQDSLATDGPVHGAGIPTPEHTRQGKGGASTCNTRR